MNFAETLAASEKAALEERVTTLKMALESVTMSNARNGKRLSDLQTELDQIKQEGFGEQTSQE